MRGSVCRRLQSVNNIPHWESRDAVKDVEGEARDGSRDGSREEEEEVLAADVVSDGSRDGSREEEEEVLAADVVSDGSRDGSRGEADKDKILEGGGCGEELDVWEGSWEEELSRRLQEAETAHGIGWTGSRTLGVWVLWGWWGGCCMCVC